MQKPMHLLSFIPLFVTYTHPEVEGFRPKVLALTTGIGAPTTGLVRYHFFWIFTMLGLTVPYRIWFSKHCTNLEVTIDKEINAFPP